MTTHLTPKKLKRTAVLAMALGAALAGCVSPEEVQVDDVDPPVAAGGPENTYDHPEASVDVWRIVARQAKEGPPEYNARVHGCPKIKYAAFGNLLRSRGVQLEAGGVSAGGVYRDSDLALGVANYGARKAEAVELTASSAAKVFDIILLAAPEIIGRMATLEACMVNGVGTEMFLADGTCNPDGITCLTGIPATGVQVELCNEMINRATTPQKGREIAVATIAAAAHTCE